MNDDLDSHAVAYKGSILYDYDNDIQMNWYPQRVLRLAGTASSILELGLGHGITAVAFSPHFKKHVVLEASPAVIKDFKNKHPACCAEIIETYFENFESDEKFDVIVLGFVLEHVEDPVKIIRYYIPYLSPKGKMFVAVPNAEVLNRRLGYLAGLLDDMQQLSDHDHLCGHKRYYTVTSLSEDVKMAGCEMQRVEGIYLKPFTTTQMMSLNLTKSIQDALCEVGIGYPELCCGILAQIRQVSI